MLLAHVTDIHVGRAADYPGPGEEGWRQKSAQHAEELLVRVLDDIAAQAPDHVVVTGDLTMTARRGQFERARRHLDAHLPGLSISALPGNHDVWTAEAVDGGFFFASLGDLAESDLAGDGFPYCHLLPGVALLALDSSPHDRGGDPALAPGRVDRAQLSKLAALAAHPEVRSRFLVVLLHHHLRLSAEDAARPDPRDWTPLANAAEVEEALARLPVGLVLHGHRHQAMRLDLSLGGRTVPVLCPGSGSRVHPDPGRTARWGLYRIEDGALRDARLRAWDPVSKNFGWV